MMKPNEKVPNALGVQRKRWPRVDDGIKPQDPCYPFGSLSEFNYKNKICERSPGPVYKPAIEDILENAPKYSMLTLASRQYDQKHRNEARSPGPIYKPNYRHTSKNNASSGFMGSLASRDYDAKIRLKSKSPGPVYNPKKGTTSNRPPSKNCSIRTRYPDQEDKESKIIPGPNAYFPNSKHTSKSSSGGYISTLASREYHQNKVQTSRSPGPVFLPKTNGTSTMPPPRAFYFGSKFKYSDEIEKSKYVAGPGSYTPEIIPRFKRKKRKGK